MHRQVLMDATKVDVLKVAATGLLSGGLVLVWVSRLNLQA
jgi:hypothetical protein